MGAISCWLATVGGSTSLVFASDCSWLNQKFLLNQHICTSAEPETGEKYFLWILLLPRAGACEMVGVHISSGTGEMIGMYRDDFLNMINGDLMVLNGDLMVI